MGKTVQYRGIPTELSLEQFRQFVLPHLTVGRRGPVPKLSLHALFNLGGCEFCGFRNPLYCMR
jgi:hypothetical protein